MVTSCISFFMYLFGFAMEGKDSFFYVLDRLWPWFDWSLDWKPCISFLINLFPFFLRGGARFLFLFSLFTFSEEMVVSFFSFLTIVGGWGCFYTSKKIRHSSIKSNSGVKSVHLSRIATSQVESSTPYSVQLSLSISTSSRGSRSSSLGSFRVENSRTLQTTHPLPESLTRWGFIKVTPRAEQAELALVQSPEQSPELGSRVFRTP